MGKANSLIYEKICCQLKRAGFKATPQRRLIIEALIENYTNVLTAEQIHETVKTKISTVGLATVYRTLELLVELEIVNKIPIQGGLYGYELNFIHEECQPYYLLCIQCGEIIEINERIFNNMAIELIKECQFKILNYQLTFHGVCKKCQVSEVIK